MEILLENEIKTYDSLLLAIEEEYVDGLEILLEHEERIWKPGTPHSWEVSSALLRDFYLKGVFAKNFIFHSFCIQCT